VLAEANAESLHPRPAPAAEPPEEGDDPA
jgi:hypothetical protein